MDVLIDALLSPPVLALSKPLRNMTLDRSACDVQIGCGLLQVQHDKKTRLIGYWSRSLNDAGQKYDTKHREYIAIVWAVLLLRRN